MWWIGTFPQNLTLIHLAASEKTGSTDGRTTTDGWRTKDAMAMTVTLLFSSTKENKTYNNKILKYKTRNTPKIWGPCTFPQNLTLIRLVVSEKTSSTDRRTTNARAMTVALFCSSTKQSKKTNVMQICLSSVPNSQMSPLFSSTTSHFLADAWYFETTISNAPQKDLNTTRSKVLLICVTSIKLFALFAVWPVVFELQAILWKVHLLTPKLPWRL